jgi:hypothetical protein
MEQKFNSDGKTYEKLSIDELRARQEYGKKLAYFWGGLIFFLVSFVGLGLLYSQMLCGCAK